jgi:hypothetical protein
MVMFRVGAFDAEFLEKEFMPYFTTEDLVNLGFAQVYIKLMIDGVTSRPFSSTTLPPIPPESHNYRNQVVEYSRRQFSMPRAEVEENIKKWHEEFMGDRKTSEKPRGKSPIEQALDAVLAGKPTGHSTSRTAQPTQQPTPRPPQGTQPHPSPHHPQQHATHSSGHAPSHSSSHASSHTQHASRPHTAHTHDNSRPTSHLAKQEASNDREKALRKAVSLSYLRQTGKIKTEVKDKKAPTNEHLADLRAALQGLVGTENADSVMPVQAVNLPQPPRETARHEDKISEEKSQTTDQRPQVSDAKEVPEDVLRKILQED